jgi:thermostable 8-oxoguanine DNA glycosylase
MRSHLLIPPHQLRALIERYDPNLDPRLEDVSSAAKAQGYLTKEQLHQIAHWKSPRRAGLVLENPESFVREITAIAFAAKHEETRIGALVLLKGVRYPIASVILHFCVDRSYPILDFRAIESLGLQKPSAYSPAYWAEYTKECRALASNYSLTVRELDMALWQYSKEHS